MQKKVIAALVVAFALASPASALARQGHGHHSRGHHHSGEHHGSGHH